MLLFFLFFSAGRDDLGYCFCDFRVPTCPSLSGYQLLAWLQELLKLKPSETQTPLTTEQNVFFLSEGLPYKARLISASEFPCVLTGFLTSWDVSLFANNFH